MHTLIPTLLLVLLTAPALRAQVEWAPYLNWQFASEVTVDDATLTGNGPQLGLDVLLGSRHLAPLFGIAYTNVDFEPKGDNDFGDDAPEYSHLSFPVGLAYRVLPPAYSTNILLHAALEPALFVSTGGFDDNPNFNLRGRVGLSFFLQPAALHLRYHYGGKEGILLNENRLEQWSLGLGVMF